MFNRKLYYTSLALLVNKVRSGNQKSPFKREKLKWTDVVAAALS